MACAVVFRLWAFCEKITKSVGRGAEECGDEEGGGIGEGEYKSSSSGFGEKAIRSSNNLSKVSALLFMAPTNASKGEKGQNLRAVWSCPPNICVSSFCCCSKVSPDVDAAVLVVVGAIGSVGLARAVFLV